MRLGAVFAERLEMLNTSDLLNPFLRQREPLEGKSSYYLTRPPCLLNALI